MLGETERIRGLSTILRTGLAAISLVTFVLALQMLGDVDQKLKDLRSSQHDNVIWNLTQLEVEFLKFERALLQAGQPDAPNRDYMAELRRRFDVYFSRVHTLNQAPLTARAFDETKTQIYVDVLLKDVEDMVKFMELDDVLLFEKIPILRSRVGGRGTLVRRVIGRGNLYVAQLGQNTREDLTGLILRLSFATIVLLLSLALIAAQLYRSNLVTRRAARVHKRSSIRYSTVIETSPDALIMTSSDGRIVEFNPAAEVLLGVERIRAIGRRFNRYLENGEGETAAFPLTRKGGVAGVELMLWVEGQNRIPVEVSQGVAQLETQPYYVYYLRDISDRKAADKALKLSRDRALAGERAKSRFLAVMSHEMRTPLNGILGVLQLMRERKTDKAQEKHFLEVMDNSAQILLGHVNEVLDIAQLESDGVHLKEAPFDLDATLDEILAQMEIPAQRRRNRLHLEKSEAVLGGYMADQGRLRQVLINIVGNALKFTQDGEVTLSVTCKRQTAADRLEFQVSDSGIGIDEEDLPRVFEDFIRIENAAAEHSEGTGLGLGIAKRIVEAMGGEIGAESELGEGSLFWVILPLVPVRPWPPEESAEVQETQLGTARKILVVEDNETNRLIVREMLLRDGHDVHEAVNGLEGYERALVETYDLILMDLSMPVMGGIESSRRIRASGGASSQTRIVALTAHVLDRDEQLFSQVGIDGVLPKPLQIEALRAVLRGGQTPKTATRGDSLALLDLKHLEQVKTALGPEQLQTLLSNVDQEVVTLLAAIKPQENANLREKLAVQVHSVAGSAAMLGLLRLRVNLNQLETQLISSENWPAETWQETIRKIWQDTQQALKDRLEAAQD